MDKSNNELHDLYQKWCQTTLRTMTLPDFITLSSREDTASRKSTSLHFDRWKSNPDVDLLNLLVGLTPATSYIVTMTTVKIALFLNLVDHNLIFEIYKENLDKIKILNDYMTTLNLTERQFTLYKFCTFIDWEIGALQTLTLEEALELIPSFIKEYPDTRAVINIFKMIDHELTGETKLNYKILTPYLYSQLRHDYRIELCGPKINDLYKTAIDNFFKAERKVSDHNIVYKEISLKWGRIIIFLYKKCLDRNIEIHQMFSDYTGEDMKELFIEFIQTETEVKNDRVKNDNKNHPAKKFFYLWQSLFRHLGKQIISCHNEFLLMKSTKVVEYIENLRENNPKRELYTDEDFDKLFNYVKLDPINNLFISFMQEIALRTSAYGRITVSHLINEDWTIKTQSSILEKGAKYRTIVFSKTIQNKISEYIATLPKDINIETYKVFITLDVKWPNNYIQNKFKKIAQAVGLPSNKQYIHLFRHTLVTTMVNNGNRIDVVQNYIGHSRIDCTEDYCWTNPTLKPLATPFNNRDAIKKIKYLYENNKVNKDKVHKFLYEKLIEQKQYDIEETLQFFYEIEE